VLPVPLQEELDLLALDALAGPVRARGTGVLDRSRLPQALQESSHRRPPSVIVG
jgi:hypothetical protein